MAKDLFATAPKTSTATKGNAKEKEKIDISKLSDDKGKPKYPEAGQLLVTYQKNHAQKAEAEAMLKMTGDQLKEIGLEIWADKFEKSGTRPDSFIMSGLYEKMEDGKKVAESGQLMFISSDSYKKVDEITATILESKYNCIERQTTYYFDNELLQKYSSVISKAIMASKAIAPEDKEKLILKKEDVIIKKGTIENVGLISSITGEPEKVAKPKNGEEEVPVYEKFKSVKELVEKVEPTFSLKNC